MTTTHPDRMAQIREAAERIIKLEDEHLDAINAIGPILGQADKIIALVDEAKADVCQYKTVKNPPGIGDSYECDKCGKRVYALFEDDVFCSKCGRQIGGGEDGTGS